MPSCGRLPPSVPAGTRALPGTVGARPAGAWFDPDAPVPVVLAAADVDEPTVRLPLRREVRRRSVCTAVALGLLLGGFGAAGWSLGHSAATSAAVGDCLTGAGTTAFRLVDCGDPAARFRVAERRENRTAADAGSLACREVPSASNSYWEGDGGDTGTVLCLAPAG